MAYRRPANAAPKADAHQVITDQIIALLEQGVRPWSRSWGGAEGFTRPLRVTGVPYRGINVLVLWMQAQLKGYTNPTWMTFNQAKQFGAHVRKGEKGTQIVLFKPFKIEEGTENEKTLLKLDTFTVFNCEQIENLPAKFATKTATVATVVNHQRIPHADAYFDGIDIKTNHGGNKAFYVVSQDRVQMPKFETFFTAEAYYATRAHEDVHATRHPSRLDRDFGKQRFGDDGYAMEELVAELGAAFIMADLGLVNHPRDDHASYIDHWLKVLKGDKKAIFTAASHAEKAVKHLNEMAGAGAAVTDVADESDTEERLAA